MRPVQYIPKGSPLLGIYALASREGTCYTPLHMKASDVYALQKQAAQDDSSELAKQLADAQAQIGGVVFCVARDNAQELTKRLESLNKRAKRAGLPFAQMRWTGEREVLNYKRRRSDTQSYDFMHEYVIVSGDTLEIPGFRMIAKLTHTQEGGTLISRVPLAWLGDEVIYSEIDLSQYFTADPHCDHCSTKRRRKETFILHCNDGQIRQIGRTCLRDYTGSDSPEKIAKHLEYVEDFFRHARNSTGDRPLIPVLDYLVHVNADVRMYGYRKGVTKGSAASNYWHLVHGTTGDPDYITPTPEDLDLAQRVIEWGKTINVDESDFLHNVKTLLEQEYADAGYGFLAYAPIAYAKEMRKRDALNGHGKENERGEVDHISTVGTRIVRQFTVKRTISVRSEYNPSGYCPMYILEDEYGNPARWFSSRDVGLLDGGVYLFRATVKAHEVHDRYGKTTTLTRCKIEATISEPE